VQHKLCSHPTSSIHCEFLLLVCFRFQFTVTSTFPTQRLNSQKSGVSLPYWLPTLFDGDHIELIRFFPAIAKHTTFFVTVTVICISYRNGNPMVTLLDSFHTQVASCWSVGTLFVHSISLLFLSIVIYHYYVNSTYSFFFLIQQFITRSVRADRGSYFITMYRQTESTLKQKKEKEKEKKR